MCLTDCCGPTPPTITAGDITRWQVSVVINRMAVGEVAHNTHVGLKVSHDPGDPMSIESQRQCETPHKKLLDLARLYEKKQQESGNEYVRDLTLRSLQKRINQFKEQIARFESRVTTSVSE